MFLFEYPECQKLVKPGVFPDYFILKQGLIEDEANLLVEPYKSTGMIGKIIKLIFYLS